MKRLLYILPTALALLAVSCAEDFLEQRNLYEKVDENYYATQSDIEEALAGAYAAIPVAHGSQHPIFIANLKADYCFGSGGVNNINNHDISDFTNNSGENTIIQPWEQSYKGILRTNMLISRFDQAKFNNQAARNQALGEAYYLRGYFYFRLAQLFGTVPVTITPEPEILPRAEPEELFGRIASDLKKAIELMPATPYHDIPTARLGHASKWAAQALMARAFLFYTGFYKSNDMPLVEGGSVSKEDVIGWLDDLIDNSGHDLIPDFRNLWPYSYPNPAYPYGVANGLDWIGEEGANYEAIFVVKYSPYGGWSEQENEMLEYSNQLVLYHSPRQQSREITPWGSGWGGGSVNPQILEGWPDEDPRKKGSIMDVTDSDEGNIVDLYKWGSDNHVQETGYYMKKYTCIQVPNEEGLNMSIYSLLYFPSQTDQKLWNMQDETIIRFADVLLMAAELKEEATPLNRVRARAGLPAIGYSLENLKNERKWELAFEGLRYYDLLRWDDAKEAFAKVKDVPVYNIDKWETYTTNFRMDRAFLPIPESEVRLSNGVLEQHPGWE